jgi:dihydrofolate reductase (trimethoprim resistance protein)
VARCVFASWHLGRPLNSVVRHMPSDVRISLVAAMAENRVIGDGPNIPWRIPGEQKIFRRLTEGGIIAMGRKTFESIGRALPNRQTVVITRQPGYVASGCTVVATFDEAVEFARCRSGELFVAGGAQIFALAIARADRIYLTEIHREFAGDARFPEIAGSFSLVEAEEVSAEIPYTFKVYERNRQAYV